MRFLFAIVNSFLPILVSSRSLGRNGMVQFPLPMDPEKTMRFLLEQAARFDAQMQSLAAEQKQFRQEQEQSHQQFRKELDEVTQVIGRIAQLHVAQHQRLDGLIQHGQEVDRRIDALVEAQKDTDGRLNALIRVVDDIVRHNGRHS